MAPNGGFNRILLPLVLLATAWGQAPVDEEDYGLTQLADRVLARARAWRGGRFRPSLAEPLAAEALAWAASRPDLTAADASEFPYWNIIPQYRTALLPGAAAPVSFAGRCFSTVTADMAPVADGTNATFALTFRADWPVDSAVACTEQLALLTTSGWQLVSLRQGTTGPLNWTVPADATAADWYDFETKGIRVHQFMNDRRTTAANLKETVLLFEGMAFKEVTERAVARNVDFLERYSMFRMPDRDPTTNVNLTRDMVQSGDTFGIIRLDGTDPMLAWASGAATGHMTTAIWSDDDLFVCESTVADAYWPKDGIQCHVFEDWLLLAANASFYAVHMPLTAEAAAAFDETGAWNFFHSTSGLDYGWQTLLWGWLDTVIDNYPCLPPDYGSNCLQWQLIETLFAIVDRAVPATADLLWTQALNKRLNTSDLRTAQAWQEADEVGIGARNLFAVVEQDAWLYDTVNVTSGEAAQGQDMVCCVFVCHMLKAGGLFDGVDGGRDAVNCGEMTNADLYQVDFYESFQQILGDKTLTLEPGFAGTAPYAHMDESCETPAPNYERTEGC